MNFKSRKIIKDTRECNKYIFNKMGSERIYDLDISRKEMALNKAWKYVIADLSFEGS